VNKFETLSHHYYDYYDYYYYYYYYNLFTSLWILSRATQLSRYQKGTVRKVKPTLFTGARDSEWQ